MRLCLSVIAVAVAAVAFGEEAARTTSAKTAPSAIHESPRQIPIAASVDVVVAGGSTGAVSAAIEAAKAGAKVFLVAPRHYLGEDMAGTLRVFLEPGEALNTPLAKSLFTPPPELGDLRFKYETEPKSTGVHKDTWPYSRLADGQWSDPTTESVQYDGDVTVRIDLGGQQPLKSLDAIGFRGGDYGIESLTVSTSDDRKQWKEIATVKPREPRGNRLRFTVPLDGQARYLRCLFKKTATAKRILLGEILIDSGRSGGKPVESRSTTPAHVKRTLDLALAQAGVQWLYGSYATELLHDGQGRPAGVVMANRAGRQAIAAKVVIDATPAAHLARQAGARFHPFEPGAKGVRWIVISKEAKAASPTLQVRKFDMPVETGTRVLGQFNTSGAAWYEYAIRLELQDASWAARARLDQAVRDHTYTPGQLFSADEPLLVSPNRIRGTKGSRGASTGGAAIDLDVFRPAGVPQVWVLGACADMPRADAEKLLRPVTLMEVGSRIGKAAAAEAKQVPSPDEVRLPRQSAEGSLSAGEVKELLGGLRPLPVPRTVPQEDRPLAVLGSYDVVVIGGGTAGAAAGIAAARQKASTLVVEYQNGLGGVGTLGMIGGFWYGNRVGFTKDVPQSPTEVRMQWYRSELRKAGADIWFGSLGCGALVEGNRVRGVVVATPYGRGIVLAKTVVDATGSADTPIATGASYVFVEEDYALQAAHLPSRNPGQWYLNGNLPAIDDADPLHVRAVIHEKLERTRRDFDVGQLIDTRERRRIVGDFCLDWLDVINRRTFPDTVVHSCSDYDSHGYQIHPYFSITHVPARTKYWANVPYRCLLPKGIEGILVVGIAMSAHRDAMPITRMQPDQHNLGYAAGAAAAMASRQNTTPRAIDVKQLQRHLVEVGNLTEEVLTASDSFPISPQRVREAAEAVTNAYQDLEVLLASPGESLPLLREAYRRANADEKLVHAHVLAAMGDATGLPSLLEAIRVERSDVQGKHRGRGGRYGMIRAIGFTRDRRAVPALAKIARAKATAGDFQLVRAVAFALGHIGDPAAADALAELFEASRPEQVRPQTLMAACALYRCGDKDGRAKTWLTRCVEHEDGTLARLAWQTLQAASGAVRP